MPVTKTEVKRMFSETKEVKQYGSKQLFLVDGNKLVSYKTIVARLVRDSDDCLTWVITPERYSATTMQHINWFIRNCTFIRHRVGDAKTLTLAP